jgi:hypothetical protein
LSTHIPKLFYQRILCDALALAFQEIQTVLRSDQVTSGGSEKIKRQLHEIEGVFNFMQQPGLAGLLAVIREIFQNYPNQKNHMPPLQLIDEIFAKLFFFWVKSVSVVKSWLISCCPSGSSCVPIYQIAQ